MLIEAIVIKKAPTREHDQLVTLYSGQLGKLTAIAKSALKPHSTQALQLDAGNIIRCELVSGHATPIITGAQAVRCFSRAKSSPPLWAAVQFFLQVIDSVVYDQEEDASLWGCLSQTLCTIDGADPVAMLPVFRRLQDDMLDVLGYGRSSESLVASTWCGRTELDDAYERIAQRHMGSIDLFYDLVR